MKIDGIQRKIETAIEIGNWNCLMGNYWNVEIESVSMNVFGKSFLLRH